MLLKKASEISVTLSAGETVKLKVVNYDENQDIAMIRITDEVMLKIPAVVELGDSDATKDGESGNGNRNTIINYLSQTATKGIVSALNRECSNK